MRALIKGICIFLLLFVQILSSAQQSTVAVYNDINNDPVAFANIVFTPFNNNTIISGYVTDINGKVDIVVEESCLIKLSYVGFQDYTDTIHAGENKNIYLSSISYNMDEVVVTGQYSESRQDKSIYKVQVINSKEIQHRGAVNLKEMLSTELNIRTSQDNALGSSLKMQGLGGEHVKFLIDGVPVIGRENGNIDLDQ